MCYSSGLSWAHSRVRSQLLGRGLASGCWLDVDWGDGWGAGTEPCVPHHTTGDPGLSTTQASNRLLRMQVCAPLPTTVVHEARGWKHLFTSYRAPSLKP